MPWWGWVLTHMAVFLAGGLGGFWLLSAGVTALLRSLLK